MTDVIEADCYQTCSSGYDMSTITDGWKCVETDNSKSITSEFI